MIWVLQRFSFIHSHITLQHQQPRPRPPHKAQLILPRFPAHRSRSLRLLRHQKSPRSAPCSNVTLDNNGLPNLRAPASRLLVHHTHHPHHLHLLISSPSSPTHLPTSLRQPPFQVLKRTLWPPHTPPPSSSLTAIFNFPPSVPQAPHSSISPHSPILSFLLPSPLSPPLLPTPSPLACTLHPNNPHPYPHHHFQDTPPKS